MQTSGARFARLVTGLPLAKKRLMDHAFLTLGGFVERDKLLKEDLGKITKLHKPECRGRR